MLKISLLLWLFLAALPSFSQVTVLDGLSYSVVNPGTRQFRIYYRTGTPTNAALPIVVWIHGGGWLTGSRADPHITPNACNGDQTTACWLADHGYVVYSIDYTLVHQTATGTDLAVSAPNNLVTASSYEFTQRDVGSALNVVSGTGGWNPGGYRVTAVANGAAQLDGSPGTVGLRNGGYTLINAATLWPAQWQDCNCFLRYLAETAGVTVPGDPHRIVLMGNSAGGQLAGVVGLSGNDAFPNFCDHTSRNYTIKGIVSFSPPGDLVTLYSQSQNAASPVRNLLGCIPNTRNCDLVGRSASITNYVGPNLPTFLSFSGASDTTVPPANAQEVQTAYANLNPPISQRWIEFGPAFSHPLDVFYYPDCAAGNEPSPCGSAGLSFQNALPFIQSVTSR